MAIAKTAIENNQESFGKDILNQFIVNQGLKYKGTPKLSPTITDFEQFNTVFNKFENHIEIKNNQKYGEPTGNITKAFDLIELNISKRCIFENSFNEEIFENIASLLLEKLAFVQIILGAQHNAHQVFDSLNSKGIKLENKDLIRNLVF